MGTNEIISLILSIVTIITAVIAVLLSTKQIKLSNKQSLFDRRLKIYIAVKDLINLCNENRHMCEKYLDDMSNGPVIDMDTLFFWMTNNQMLESCQKLGRNLLKNDEQNVFMHKLAELNSMSEEAKLIFRKKTDNLLSDFILNYKIMLLGMYQYIIFINGSYKNHINNGEFLPTNNKKENSIRDELVKRINNILDLSRQICDAKFNTKMQKQITL